jgi:GT2 family glycosyltransferase
MQWINKCLNSCKGYQIIVVDNNSKDHTVNFISKNFPEVKILNQHQNLGFGAANNIGIRYALSQGAEYVFLLNQDAYLKPNTIDTLVKVHQANPSFGILSPIHINGEEKSLDKNFSSYISYNNNPSLFYDALTNNLKSIYEVPFVNAAAWLLPKSTLLKIGGFDPLFFHYGEDDNYCQRVLFHKLKIGVVPTTFVVHDRDNKIRKPIPLFSEEYFKEKEKYYKIHWGNINEETDKLISNKETSLKKKIRRSIFKLNVKAANNYKKEYNLIKKIKNTIINSRNINKKIGSNYLD